MKINILKIGVTNSTLRSMCWPLCAISLGLVLTVAGMFKDSAEQAIPTSTTPPQVIENVVHTYQLENSTRSSAVIKEYEPAYLIRINNTVQTEGMRHLSVTALVAKKGAVDRPPLNLASAKMKAQFTTGLVKEDTPIAANNESYPLAKISFNSPQSITTDGLNLYVADTNNHKIRMIEIATGRVGTLAGSGAKGDADGFGEAASFNHPRGVVAEGYHLYVTDSGNHSIRKINLVTGQVVTLAGSVKAGDVDKAGSEARFNSPRGIAISGTKLYVADYFNQSIRSVDIETGSVATEFPKRGWMDSSKKKLSYFPGSIVIDEDTMYVADYDNHTIRKIQLSSGKMDVMAGSSRAGDATGIGKAASFNYPCEITIIGDALYVADSGSHTIRKIEITSGMVTKFAGSGSIGILDDVGESATFGAPFGLTTYGNKLYVADQGNHEIRQIDLSNGKVETMVGSVQAGAIDSMASNTKLPEKML